MSSEDVVCGGVKCPECCGPSCPVFSSLWKVKSQTSRRVALGPPAWCSHVHSSPLSPFVWGAWSSSDRCSQGVGAAGAYPQGAICWGAGTRHTDEIQTQSGTEAPEGLGCPPGDRPEAQTSELPIKERRHQLPTTGLWEPRLVAF